MVDLAHAPRAWELTSDLSSPYSLSGASSARKGLQTFVDAGVAGKTILIMEAHRVVDQWQWSHAVVTDGDPDTYVISDIIESSEDDDSQVAWSKGPRDVFIFDPPNYSPGAINTVTGLTVLDQTHSLVIGNSASALPITLPPVADYAGKEYVLKSINSGTVTISEDSGDTNTVENDAGTLGTSVALTSSGSHVRLRSDGTAWRFLGGDLSAAGGISIGDSIGSGTAGSVLFVGNSTDLQQDNSNFYWDPTNKRLGIGTSSFAAKLHVATTAGGTPRGIVSSQHSDTGGSARLNLRKSRGTVAAPTVITTGDALGRVSAWGHDGTQMLEMGAIAFVSTGTIATNRVPTYFTISTATDAAPSVLTERIRVGPAGKTSIGTTTAATLLTVEGTLTLKEQAAADADTAAYGQWWVKDDAPNTPWFTNDDGTDFQLATLDGTETLTNKTINTASNTITVVEADISDLQAYLLNITAEPLSDLSDVTITSIATGELLKWNGSAWINNTLAEAGIAAASHTHTEADITDLGTAVAMVADNLSVFAATTSAQLAGVISDETGSGALVFATSPTFVTDITTPLVQQPALTGHKHVFYPGITNDWAIGIQGHTMYCRSDLSANSDGGFAFYYGGVHSDTKKDPGAGGTFLAVIQNNGLAGFGTSSPDSRVHAFSGSAGAVTALSGTVITAENSDNAYISILTPNNKVGGILFGDADASWRGQVNYDHSNDDMGFFTSATERMAIDSSGNVLIGTTTSPTGTHGKVLSFGANGGDPTMGTDVAAIFAKDVGGTNVAMHFIDEADTVTQMTPHDKDGEWVFNSYNRRTKKRFHVKMEKLLKRLAEKFPEDFADLIDEDFANV